MKNKNKPFIVTTDYDTKNKLINLGFELISESDNKYTFLNDCSLKFSNSNLDKICFTDKMCI